MGCNASTRVDQANPRALQEDIYNYASKGDCRNLEKSFDSLKLHFIGIGNEPEWYVGTYQKDQAIHKAAAKNYCDCISILLLHGANIQAKNKYGNTPLHRAAAQGSADAVDLLIDKGADINSKNDDGETPLHRAVANGREEVVKLLLQHGAIIDIKNNVDLTPEQLSAISNISPKNIRGSFFKSKMASIFQDEKLKREGVLPRSSSVKSVSRNESLREDQDDELFFSEEEK